MNANPLRWLGLVVLSLAFVTSDSFAQVRISEIMADNGGAVTAPGGGSPDYIELHNTNSIAANLSGWRITDSTSASFSNAFIFPAGTTIAANSYLVVWLDAQTNGPGPGVHATSFSLSSAGDVLSLYTNSSSSSLKDRVGFGIQVKDKPLCRFGIGPSSFWALGAPTPNAANVALTLGTPLALRLNEWLPTNSAGVDKDRLEIFNPATNGPVNLGGPNGVLITGSLSYPDTNTALVFSNSFIDAGGFVRFSCDKKDVGLGDQADHLDFRLSSSSGETLSIYLSDRLTLVDRVVFGTFTNLPLLGRDISMGRFPDGGTNIVFFYTNKTTLGDPNDQAEKITNIVINEVLSHTDPPFEDALELFNPTDESVNIGGWWISNSKDNPYKFRVPAGTAVPDRGYKVYYEQSIFNGAPTGPGFNPSGTDNAPDFTFNSAHGDNIVVTTFGPSPLLNGSNTVFQLTHAFDAAENAVPYGRYVKSDGGADLVPMSARSFGVNNPATVAQFRTGGGSLNPYPKVGPLVISEIMYHPPDIGTNDNLLDEYVELTSITNGTLRLYDPNYPTNTWSLAGGIVYSFPTNITLPPFGRLLVVNFNPFTNAPQLAAFRSVYGLSPAVPIFGPYGGKLVNSSEILTLYKPDAVQLPPKPDAGYVPQVFVEKVKYEDVSPWPTNADGGGVSLQRLSLTGYANDHTNWFAAPPTPGATNAQAAESVEVFAAEITSGSSFVLNVATTPGRSYLVESSTNLIEGSWVPVTNFTASGSMTCVTNYSTLLQFPFRFYRARSL
jgi:hypothetical protein